MTTNTCPHCNAALKRPDANFCQACGKSIPPAADDISQKPTRTLSQTTPAAPVTPPPLTANRDEDASTATRLLAAPGFEPLPEGALLPLDTPRYQVVGPKNSSAPHIYTLTTLNTAHLCTNTECTFYQNETDVYCSKCKGSTSSIETLQYQMTETEQPTPLYTSLAILDQHNLNSAGFWLYPYFLTNSRYYVLKPTPGPALANTVKLPVETAQVLNWGQQLAEALHQLHSINLVWIGNIEPQHIAVENKHARWINLNIGNTQTSGDQPRNVQQLASLLFYLATGLQQYTPANQLPPTANQIFEQALGTTPTLATAAALQHAFEGTLKQMRKPAAVRVISYAQTDTGQVRDHNEDSMLAQETTLSNIGAGYPVGLYVVADGMGGHSAGEVASGDVVKTLQQKMALEITAHQPQPDEIDAESWLRTAIQTANKTVYNRAKQTGTDMGTTVVAALLLGDTVTIGHVGDSRAYLLNNQEIHPLTTDHSVVERLVATGQITPEEARTHPQRNIIYRTIGDKANIEADVSSHQLSPGDCLLLCSDGLSGMVTDETLYGIYLNNPDDLRLVARSMINAANTAGGDDNITVVLVKIEADQ